MKQGTPRKPHLEENWYDCISIRQSRPQENYNKEVFSDNDRDVNSRRKRDDPKLSLKHTIEPQRTQGKTDRP